MIELAFAMALLGQEAPASDDPRTVMLGHFRPLVTLDVDPALSLESEIFSLYFAFTAPPLDGGSTYLAWRRLSEHRGRPSVVEWARVDACSGAEAVTVALEDMPLPRVDIPRIGRDDGQFPPTDGVGYRLWFKSGSWPDGFAYEASVHSNVDTPLAAWAERLRTTMAPCWSSEEPAAWNSYRQQG